MIVYPAIDLKDGACVRLKLGDMAQATLFNLDPAAQARMFAAAGAEWLHVVDLDGAIAGRTMNRSAIEAIVNATAVPIQLGGGIRDMESIQQWLESGIARVVLGTAAIEQTSFVRAAAQRFPGRVAVALDARGGKLSIEGWTEATAEIAEELAIEFEKSGAAALLYTDIDRDGMLLGVNVAATAALAQRVAIPVIASGGVASVDDITALKCHAGVSGVVIGRALYDGRLDLAAAIAAARG